MDALTQQFAPGTMDPHSSACVLRERFLFYLTDKVMQEMAKDKPKGNHTSKLMSRKLGNMVMCGAGFWINKKQLLMGYVILPKAEGLDVRGRFTLRTAGTPDGLDVEMMQFTKRQQATSDKILEYHNLDGSHEEEFAVYKMEVSEYGQKKFWEKYLKTSRARKEPHYEIQIDVEVVLGRNELTLPQARRDSLVKDVSQLLEDKGSSDMVIQCQGELVPCHRAMLVAR